jgi:plasmid stabilization system protein ParE
MSVRKATLRLSREADRDIEDIVFYTQRTWGEKQRAGYRTAILRTLDMLSEHPQAGRLREELFLGCRSIMVEQHIIYFHLPQAGEIENLRILLGYDRQRLLASRCSTPCAS